MTETTYKEGVPVNRSQYTADKVQNVLDRVRDRTGGSFSSGAIIDALRNGTGGSFGGGGSPVDGGSQATDVPVEDALEANRLYPLFSMMILELERKRVSKKGKDIKEN